mmetsp:Transcript_41155/g.66730  ORF Transcript_41155/g.66730 Transcript_41155/m.66730 type:complete len:83 (-) Transcript_41155:1465-1713(-)
MQTHYTSDKRMRPIPLRQGSKNKTCSFPFSITAYRSQVTGDLASAAVASIDLNSVLTAPNVLQSEKLKSAVYNQQRCHHAYT